MVLDVKELQERCPECGVPLIDEACPVCDWGHVGKKAIPYKKTPLADEGAAWDSAAEVKAADVDDLKVMCAIVQGTGENKGDYKLPHHKGKAPYACVLAGVQAAGGVLAGARGGIKGTADEIAGAKGHLEKHYHEFDRKAPWEAQKAELAAKAKTIHDDVDRLIDRLESEGAGKTGIRALRVYLKEVAAKLKEMLGEIGKAAEEQEASSESELIEALGLVEVVGPEIPGPEEDAQPDEELQALLDECAGTGVALSDEEPAIDTQLVPIRKPWDETDNEISHRIRDPGDFQKDSFRRITLKKDKPRIFAIVGRLKGKTTTTIQALRFPKADGWTVASAKKWVADHPDIGKGPTAKRLYVEILKQDDEEHLITGVAMAANRVDLQTDYIEPSEIKKTMIAFMERYQQFGLDHKGECDQVRLVECWQARASFVEEGSKYQVQKDDWVVTVHVLDEELWQRVKSGEYRGFSIEGYAHRIPVDVDELPESVELPEEVAA
jgi:hypothetical protein